MEEEVWYSCGSCDEEFSDKSEIRKCEKCGVDICDACCFGEYCVECYDSLFIL